MRAPLLKITFYSKFSSSCLNESIRICEYIQTDPNNEKINIFFIIIFLRMNESILQKCRGIIKYKKFKVNGWIRNHDQILMYLD